MHFSLGEAFAVTGKGLLTAARQTAIGISALSSAGAIKFDGGHTYFTAAHGFCYAYYGLTARMSA